MSHDRQRNDRLQGLYAITDELLIPEHAFARRVEAALAGGTRIIQYRDKSSDSKKRLQQAQQLRRLCSDYRALCLINDDIELAREVNADGVHLGRDDHSLEQARALLGEKAIIGISCYDRLELARTAENNGADYVAFGAMFPSPTKPEACLAGTAIIRQARTGLQLPVCAIGGITAENIQTAIHEGADMVAVISAVFAGNDITGNALALSRGFKPTI